MSSSRGVRPESFCEAVLAYLHLRHRQNDAAVAHMRLQHVQPHEAGTMSADDAHHIVAGHSIVAGPTFPSKRIRSASNACISGIHAITSPYAARLPSRSTRQSKVWKGKRTAGKPSGAKTVLPPCSLQRQLQTPNDNG